MAWQALIACCVIFTGESDYSETSEYLDFIKSGFLFLLLLLLLLFFLDYSIILHVLFLIVRLVL